LLELRNTSTDEYVTVISKLGACLHQVCLVCEEVLHPLLWAAGFESFILLIDSLLVKMRSILKPNFEPQKTRY
jgi:hypothetical protein